MGVGRGYEIIILALIVLVLFGAKRLPDSARALGKSLRILKSEARAMREDGQTETHVSSAGTAEQTAAPRTIQAAPGDVTDARPVSEPVNTTKQN
jgi:sec-independent protein translocase protein TatA